MHAMCTKELTVSFTDGAVIAVEHAHVTSLMSTCIDEAPFLTQVKGHVARGAGVPRLSVHAGLLAYHIEVYKHRANRKM